MGSYRTLALLALVGLLFITAFYVTVQPDNPLNRLIDANGNLILHGQADYDLYKQLTTPIPATVTAYKIIHSAYPTAQFAAYKTDNPLLPIYGYAPPRAGTSPNLHIDIIEALRQAVDKFVSIFVGSASGTNCGTAGTTNTCFWIGGGGNWASGKFSNSSGGASCACVPATNNKVFWDANSGGGTASLNGSRDIGSIDTTGWTGTVDVAANTFTVNDAVSIHAAGAIIVSTGTIAFGSTSVTMSGGTLSYSGAGTFTQTGNTTLTISGTIISFNSATVTLAASTVSKLVLSGGAIIFTSGSMTAESSGGTTVNISSASSYIDFGSSTWSITNSDANGGSIWINQTTSASWNAGTSTVTLLNNAASSANNRFVPAGDNISVVEFNTLVTRGTGTGRMVLSTRPLHVVTFTAGGAASSGAFDTGGLPVIVDETLTVAASYSFGATSDSLITVKSLDVSTGILCSAVNAKGPQCPSVEPFATGRFVTKVAGGTVTTSASNPIPELTIGPGVTTTMTGGNIPSMVVWSLFLSQNSTLSVSGNWDTTFSSVMADPTSTVIMSGVAKTIATGSSFYNLTMSGTTTFNGALTISGTLTATAAITEGGVTISGSPSIDMQAGGTITFSTSQTFTNVTVSGGTLTMSGSPTITVVGNWNVYSGTFTRATSTVTMTGFDKAIFQDGSGNQFYDLTIAAGAAIKMMSILYWANTLTVNGTLIFYFAGASLINSAVEAPGVNCTNGGYKFTRGIDDGAGVSGQAGDGILQAGEVDSTVYVCNGANGSNGTNGHNSVTAQTVEGAGVNCANGGFKFTSGIDDGSGGGTADDGILQAGEIDFTSYACNGAPGANGTNGHNSVTLIAVEAPGVNCANGGFKFQSGIDDGSGGGVADDGTLQAGEADFTGYACNGANGTNGTNGHNSVTLQAVEAPGVNCANGGFKFQSGIDDGSGGGITDDGILQAGEVDFTSYACNGAAGAAGANGFNSVTLQAIEAPGVNCATGGFKFQSGIDNGDGGGTSGNNILEAGEVDFTSYACNGATGAAGTNGHNSLINQTAEPAGVNCADAGQKVDSGIDDGSGGGIADDGILQAGEITVTTYVCNGANGTPGSNGFNSLIVVTLEPPGINCPFVGGQQIDTGIDDGSGGGIAGDNILQPGELQNTSYVCNGTPGVGGGGAGGRPDVPFFPPNLDAIIATLNSNLGSVIFVLLAILISLIILVSGRRDATQLVLLIAAATLIILFYWQLFVLADTTNVLAQSTLRWLLAGASVLIIYAGWKRKLPLIVLIGLIGMAMFLSIMSSYLNIVPPGLLPIVESNKFLVLASLLSLAYLFRKRKWTAAIMVLAAMGVFLL